MHIAEGILPAQWAAAWAVPAAAGAALGLREVTKRVDKDPSFKPLLGLMGAAVFAISLMPIPVPVAGSVSHPAGTPLAAVLVGPLGTVLLAAISLILQALFFAHGGFTTLGANVISEGIAGALAGYLAFRVTRRLGGSLFSAGLMAGLLGDLAVYVTTATELALGLFPVREAPGRALAIFVAFLPTQGPLALLEGIFTGGVLRALAEARPDIALKLGVDKPRSASREESASRRPARRFWQTQSRPVRLLVRSGLVVLTGILIWGLIWSIATSTGGWVGIDAGIMERVAEEAGRPAWTPFVNTDVGDLLVLVFAAGALGAGLAIGWLARGFLAAPRRLESPAATLLLGLSAPMVLLAALASGFVGTGSWAEAAGALLHPLRGQVLSANGGDFALFLFMLSGLTPGLAAGWALRRRRIALAPATSNGWASGRKPLRLRLPHLHDHDARTGDRLAWQDRGFARVDARLKVAIALTLLVVNLLAGWLVSLGLFCLAFGVLLVVQRVRGAFVLLRLGPAVMVALMLVLLRGFTLPGRSLLTLDPPFFEPVRLTLEGLAAGGQLGLVVLAGVAVMLVLGTTTPLPAMLSALRWFRVPALLVEIGLLMYRYLFLLVEEAGRLRQAQRLRGPEVPWSRAMGGMTRLGAILLIRSYDRSQRVYDAQRLRGAGAGLAAQPSIDIEHGGARR